MSSLMPFRRKNRELMADMWDSFNDFFSDNFFAPVRSDIHPFRTDIKDEEDKYVIKADLPGFNKEDIHVAYENHYLTIQAVREQEMTEEQDHFVRQERNYGQFVRRFYMDNIDENKIDATFKDGVLTLECPKFTVEKTDHKRIEIH